MNFDFYNLRTFNSIKSKNWNSKNWKKNWKKKFIKSKNWNSKNWNFFSWTWIFITQELLIQLKVKIDINYKFFAFIPDE